MTNELQIFASRRLGPRAPRQFQERPAAGPGQLARLVALLRPVSPALTALALLALLAPPQLDLSSATAIDPRATTQGLHARVSTLDDWSITVHDAPTTSPERAVEVWLRAPDGGEHRRRLPLAGTTVEDRSRELAASLALLIKQ